MRMLTYILAMIAGFASAIIAIKLGYKPLASWQYWSILGVSLIPSILLSFYIDFTRRWKMNKFNDKYFKDKVKEFVKRNHEEITTLQSDILYIMFKEVARDVRHACAEKVLKIDIDESQKYEDDLSGNERTTQFYDGVKFAKNEAHRICVNL